MTIRCSVHSYDESKDAARYAESRDERDSREVETERECQHRLCGDKGS